MSNAQKRLWQLLVVGIAFSLTWCLAWYVYAWTIPEDCMEEVEEDQRVMPVSYAGKLPEQRGETAQVEKVQRRAVNEALII